MKTIGEFFDKFRNRATAKIQNYTIIVDSINKYTNAGITISDIEIKNGVLKIKTSSLIKNEIYMKKSQLLKEINSKVTNLSISEIG